MEEESNEVGGGSARQAGNGPDSDWADAPGSTIERLIAEQHSRLAAILASSRIPPQDAEDLLQNVLTQLFLKRDCIRCPDVWLRGALRMECRMYWRTRSRRFTTAVDAGVLELMAGGADPDQEQEVLRDRLSRWIDALDDRCRSVLRLRYHLGYEPREVADELGYRASSIDKVTRRCVEALGRKAAAAEAAPGVKTKKSSA